MITIIAIDQSMYKIHGLKYCKGLRLSLAEVSNIILTHRNTINNSVLDELIEYGFIGI